MSVENVIKGSKALFLITTAEMAVRLSNTDIWIYSFPQINKCILIRLAFLLINPEKLKELKDVEP